VLAHLSIVSMTGYWNAYKLDIPMQSPMAMAMAMMSSERNPPSMPPSQDEAHTMIADFTEITVSNSDNDLHLVKATSARLMVGCRTFRKWKYGGRCLFGCSFFLFSSLYFFTSLLLWISAQYKWRRHGFLPPPETSQVDVEFPRALDPPNGYQIVLIGCGTDGFVRLRTLNGYFIVFILFHSCTGLRSPGGLHLKTGII